MTKIRQFSPSEIKDFKISLIIPCLEEAENLIKLLPYLRESADHRLLEIIVADALSEDGSKAIAQAHHAVYLPCERACRAKQLNAGAKAAKGEILYFVHADTWPPSTFVDDIFNALELGYGLGCYPFEFMSDSLLLKLNARATRLDRLWVRGGDQSLFICKDHFMALGMFSESCTIMEEYEFIKRARKQLSFKIMKEQTIKVSARKYEENSYIKVNLANFVAFIMFSLGMNTERIRGTYKWMLNQKRT